MKSDGCSGGEGRKAYGDSSLVHRTVPPREEIIHHPCHGETAQIHAQRRTDKDAAPKSGIRVLDLLDAEFGESMGKIDQQHKPQQNEQHGTHERHIISPNLKKAIRDEETRHNQPDPRHDLGAPKSILQPRPSVLRAPHPNQCSRQNSVENPQSKVHTMHGGEARTTLPATVNRNVVEQDMLQLFDRPVGEHEPGEQAVDEEDASVGDSRGDGVGTATTGGADGAAGCCAAAGGSKGGERADARDGEEREGKEGPHGSVFSLVRD